MVKKYGGGEFFGELALLYNAPRAASIIAKSDDCLCWSLDRDCFKNIVKDASMKKRNKYVKFLSGVEILKTLKPNEIESIVDAIKEEKYKAEEKVIEQGAPGDRFYILEEGKAVAIKTFDDGVTQEVKSYNDGDYFGELALLRDEPRAATVKILVDSTFLSIEREAFKRLLGPMEKLLQKNAELYQKYSKK
jgi:cAMP-dependent protein kinase regulator